MLALETPINGCCTENFFFCKNCTDCVNTTCVCVCVCVGGGEDFVLLSLVSVVASTVLKGLIFYKSDALFTRVLFSLLEF